MRTYSRPVSCVPPCVTSRCTPKAVPPAPTLEEQIRAFPALAASLSPVVLVMNAPLGSLLLLDYEAGGEASPEAIREGAMATPRSVYLGRLTSREDHGTHVVFRMVVLNRGDVGGAMRTFSTRVGYLASARLMELPRVVAPQVPPARPAPPFRRAPAARPSPWTAPLGRIPTMQTRQA